MCDKINTFIKNTFDEHYTREKLTEFLENANITPDSMDVGPFPDFNLSIHGNRYILFEGSNLLSYRSGDEYGEMPIIDGHYNDYYFAYYFNANTGEPLHIADLFSDGFDNSVNIYVVDESFNTWAIDKATQYAGKIDFVTANILALYDYDSPPYNRGDLSDLEVPAYVFVRTNDGTMIAIAVPREFIK